MAVPSSCTLVQVPGAGGATLEIVEIKFGTEVVQVNLHGATLVSWKSKGEELIFVR